MRDLILQIKYKYFRPLKLSNMLIAYIAIDASTLAKVSHCTHVCTNIEAFHVVNIQFS